MARIKTDIWLDPEFTSLTRDAQLLWFSRKIHKQRTAFDPAEEMKIHNFNSVTEVEEAANLLRGTKYGHALNKVSQRVSIPLDVRCAIFERDGWACLYCGNKKKLEIDHVYPLSLGGSDGPENLQTLCAPCNRSKGAKVIEVSA